MDVDCKKAPCPPVVECLTPTTPTPEVTTPTPGMHSYTITNRVVQCMPRGKLWKTLYQAILVSGSSEHLASHLQLHMQCIIIRLKCEYNYMLTPSI